MTSFRAARTDLAAKLTTALTAAGLSPTVLPFDPPTIDRGDTVTVASAGVSATDWRLYVRIYVDTVLSQDGQDRLADLTEACDGVDLASLTPRGDWEFAYDEGKDCFVMLAVFEYPREDF